MISINIAPFFISKFKPLSTNIPHTFYILIHLNVIR